MEIHLVGPSVWKPEIARYQHRSASARLSADTARLAHAVLWTLQDAHAGMTPRLAYELARLFTEPSAVQQGVWAKLLRQLQDGLPRTERSGLVAGNVPVYIALKVVKPVVRESSRRLGYACLLCHDETPSGVTMEEYATYCASLERELARTAEHLASGPLFAMQHGNVVAALSEPSPLGAWDWGLKTTAYKPGPRRAGSSAFAKASAFAEASADRRGFSGGWLDPAWDRGLKTPAYTRASVPELDRASLAMLLGLRADVAEPSRASRRIPATTHVPRSRLNPGDQQGRIEGLRQSRGEAHFGSMVLSEFLNHPVVLVDRMLNSGYLVHERRPRREKLRDVLVVGLMPHAVRATVHGSFAKACWLDCMARLGRLLSSARLGDSEFRWIEGDACGRARCCSFPLGQLMPEAIASQGLSRASGHSSESREHESFRSSFVTLLRWLPDYLDTRADFRSLGASPFASPDEWAVAAWAANAGRRESSPTGSALSPTNEPAPIERFSFVHVMVFHQSIGVERDAHAARRLGALRAGLRLGYHPRRHASVTYVSADGDPAAWHFGSDSDPYRALASPTAEDGAALAGQLQTRWLDRLSKEIWHG